jgi:uncharacterized protein YxeA
MVQNNPCFLGGLIGFFVGLLVNIVCGGFIATILNIDQNIELLVHQDSDIAKTEEKKIPNSDDSL